MVEGVTIADSRLSQVSAYASVNFDTVKTQEVVFVLNTLKILNRKMRIRNDWCLVFEGLASAVRRLVQIGEKLGFQLSP